MIGKVIKMSAPGEAADSRPTQNEVNKPNYTISALLQVIKLFPCMSNRERKKECRKKERGENLHGFIYAAFQYDS